MSFVGCVAVFDRSGVNFTIDLTLSVGYSSSVLSTSEVLLWISSEASKQVAIHKTGAKEPSTSA
jgi:hypothetical protein